MAFHCKDFFHSYSRKGDENGLFNVARADDENDGLKFYAYQNEEGAFVIQRITTSGTLKIYNYYATKQVSRFDTDWTARTGLSYGEYWQIFNQ
jgi:hypothetical protein